MDKKIKAYILKHGEFIGYLDGSKEDADKWCEEMSIPSPWLYAAYLCKGRIRFKRLFKGDLKRVKNAST